MALWVDVTLHFFEMVLQHLHPGFLHGVEFLSFGLVASMVIGVVDIGGFWSPFSLALTSFFAMLSVFLRLRHGFGTIPSSFLFGFIICLSLLVSKSGV